MQLTNRVRLLVGLTAFTAAAGTVVSWQVRAPFPGWWPLAAFLLVACALEALGTQLRLSARGSTSFIIHMACALLFGGFWAAAIAGGSTLLGEAAGGKGPLKTCFNVAQRMLSVLLPVLAYGALGGTLPPAYLGAHVTLSSLGVQRDLGLFFVLAAGYFVVNSVLVSSVVALSSERAFPEACSRTTLERAW
jgi:hypothetical protein